MKPERIILEARKYVGSPYMHMGTTEYGIDCIGLVWRVAFDLGLIDIRLPAYSGEPVNNDLIDRISEHLDRIDNADIKPGDVLVFKFARFSQHVGIYTGRNIIHSYQAIRGCKEHIFDSRWKRLHVASFRFYYE